jgi:hypothetical protein
MASRPPVLTTCPADLAAGGFEYMTCSTPSLIANRRRREGHQGPSPRGGRSSHARADRGGIRGMDR